MQDEAPDGQPPLPGDASPPDPPWWPWPETQADEPTGPRDGAPGEHDTLGAPGDAPTATELDDPAPGATTPAAVEPEPALPPEPQPEPLGRAEEASQDLTRVPESLATTSAVAAAGSGPGRSTVPDVLAPPNEAIPAVPPKAGTGPIGSIPAAHARAVWSRLQASNWRLFLIRFLCAGLAVVATVAIVPGLGFVGWSWGQFTRIALIFGLLNATVKPLLQFLVLRFIFSTYGIVVVIINTLLLLLLGAVLDDTFEVYRPISLVFGGLVVGVLGLIFETLLGATPPVLDRDYKERNGLR